LCLCIGLLLLPSPIFARQPSEQLQNIEQSLTAILSYSQKLEEELENSQRISEEQSRRIGLLLSELAQLRTRLEASRGLLEKYKHRAGGLLNTIEQLETKLKQLSESYEASEASWEKTLKAAESELRRQKIKTLFYAVLAGAVTGAAVFVGLRYADH
jgi:DNA repair ATPase RecN